MKSLLYLLVADTVSAYFLLIFVCSLNGLMMEESSLEIIFEILFNTRIRERLDLSANYFAKFNVC